MRLERRALVELTAMGLIAGLIAFGIAYATGHFHKPVKTKVDPAHLETSTATYDLHEGGSRFTVKSKDGAVARDVDLTLVVDGTPRPFALSRNDAHALDGGGFHATFTTEIGDDNASGALEVRLDKPNDALVAELQMKGPVSDDHKIALRAEVSAEGQIVFVSGVGEVADRATVNGGAVVIDAPQHPLAIVSSRGTMTINALVDESVEPTDAMRVAALSPPQAFPAEATLTTDLHFTLGADGTSVWKSIYAIQGTPALHVHGSVTGTTDRAHVFGRDGDGTPQLRATAGKDNHFDVMAPTSVVEWYAAIDASRASALASFIPGTQKDLVLDVSPGGELHVSIIDPDTKKPVTARLLVRGIDGSVDPSFGPDYRASGAGPIIDAHDGEVSTPLPSGKYRVAATKGIEWTVDAKTIEITAGRLVDVQLAPRHIVPTPGMIGCDLHVHARPSFDSPVSVEDRVLSLVSAGIDFAVPTEHNVVGDYSSALETLDLTHDMLSVTGVEVTTFSRGIGHFGVFPYPTTQKVPPFRGVAPGMVFDKAREGDFKRERVVQVHHPRLPKGIGYFNIIGLQSKGPKPFIRGRMDFDTLEVYNGYDLEIQQRVDDVLRDYYALLNAGYHHGATGSSDAHRVQFHWAGYPRTMALVDGAPDKGIEGVAPATIVTAIKHGHATVTSGPIIELDIGGSRPGDDHGTQDDPVRGHVRVRAAPWIDVAKVEIVVGGRVIQSFNVEPHPTEIGPMLGTTEEIGAKTIRFDQDIVVPIGPENGWVMVVVRGERKMDDVLPFMPVAPFAFTNPIWIVRRVVPPPSTNPSPPIPSAKPSAAP
jgi:hypothetical protein